MKRKLNESLTFPVKIDVVRLVNENPELNGQMDKIASQIEDTTDATITKEESDGTVYMVIDGLTQDDIIDIFENDYYIINYSVLTAERVTKILKIIEERIIIGNRE